MTPNQLPPLPDGVTLEDLLIPLRTALDTCHDTDWSLRQFKTHISHALAALAQQAQEPVANEREAFEAWMDDDGQGPAPRICSRGSPCEGEYADHCWETAWRVWQAGRATQPAPVVPDGFALVPVEPTPEMWQAVDQFAHAGSVWDAMIAASQQKGGSAG